jgi:cellobiose-specific phosphotransferase system component IIB
MKISLLTICILFLSIGCKVSQQKTEKVDVPKGVVYNYCEHELVEKAKSIVERELSEQAQNNLTANILFVGPTIWTRFSKVEELAKIKGGKMSLIVDDKILQGKLTQSLHDSQLIWKQVKKEVQGKEYKIRKASHDELKYYWSVISFDIDEPLLILDTQEHKYILDFSPKDLKVLWIDEVP